MSDFTLTQKMIVFGIVGFSLLWSFAHQNTPKVSAWYPNGSSPVVPGSDGSAFWPDVSVDSSGWVHVVWNDINGSASRLAYIRGQLNAAGNTVTWEQVQIFSDYPTGDQTIRVVAKNGTVHISFCGRNGYGYYLYNAANGKAGYWAAENFPLSGGAWHTAIGVDDAGIVYVAWAAGVGDGASKVALSYRTAPQTWSGAINMGGGSYQLARKVRLAVFGSGNSTIVHLFYEGRGKEKDPFKVYYSRMAAGQVPGVVDFSNRVAGLNTADEPATAVDPVSGIVYAAFGYGDSKTGYKTRLAVSYDGGISWPYIASIDYGNGNSGIWTIYPWLSAGGNKVYYVTCLYVSSDAKMRIYYQSFDAASGAYSAPVQLDNGGNNSFPHISVGGLGKVAVWTLGWTDNILYNVDPGGVGAVTPVATTPAATTPTTVAPTATPTTVSDGTPKGRLQIENDSPFLKGTQTFVTFILESGSASQYKVWNEGSTEPSAYTDMKAISQGGFYVVNPWTVNTNSSGDSYPCATTKVYGKLNNKEANKASVAMSDDILVDPGVDANVQVTNPGSGATDYTKDLYYLLDVQARQGECSKLVRVRAGEKRPAQTTELSEVTNRLAADVLVMPLIPSTSANHTIIVEVTDGVGNVQTYERTITVDTTQPTLSSTGTVTASGPVDSNNQVRITFVDLQFKNINAQDDLYGSKTGETRKFWGVSIANSRQSIALTDTTKLNSLSWKPVEVTDATVSPGSNGQSYDFVIKNWNLFEGLSGDQQSGGIFYIYVRVMDGAGNVSTTVLQSNQINLSNNYVIPKKVVYLPFIVK